MKNRNLEYPLRVGKKQKRAILDANGIEIGIFNTSSEELAQEFCDYLNMKALVNRVEIIGPAGREFVSKQDSFELSIQDNGRTLKIFEK